MTQQALDLDTPSTWPDSEAELLKLAETGVPDAEPEVATAPEPEPEAKPATEPEVILAADGKHTIPYHVLKDTRSGLEQAQARVAELEAQLAAVAAPVAEAPAAMVPADTIPPDVTAQLDKIRDNWGDDIANQAERTWRLEQQLARQQQVIDQLNTHLTTQQQASQRSEQHTIEDAIAANEKLKIWSSAENQFWFDRAVDLHAMLMKTDQAYVNADWFTRMNSLPDKVEALYGQSLEKVDSSDITGRNKSAKAKIDAVLDAPPRSLSEMSGGSAPEQSTTKKLEDMSGGQLTAFFTKLANDPQKFDAYMRSIS